MQRQWRQYLKSRASKALAMLLLRQKVKRAATAAAIAHRLAHGPHGHSGAAPGSPGKEHEQQMLRDLLREGQNLEDLDEEQLQELVAQMSEVHGGAGMAQAKPGKMVSW